MKVANIVAALVVSLLVSVAHADEIFYLEHRASKAYLLAFETGKEGPFATYPGTNFSRCSLSPTSLKCSFEGSDYVYEWVPMKEPGFWIGYHHGTINIRRIGRKHVYEIEFVNLPDKEEGVRTSRTFLRKHSTLPRRDAK